MTDPELVDAIQWMIDLISSDFARMVGGIIVLIIIVEFLAKFREWVTK